MMCTPTPDRDVARRRAEEDEEAFTGSFSKKTPPKKTAVSDRWNHSTFKSVVARNQAFFEKYHRRMLVINGVDAQTNSHTVGIVHNWSGKNSEGYPTTTALLAARYAGDLPVPYLSFGGFSATGGITRFTRIDNADVLREIAYPYWDHSEQEVFGEAAQAMLKSSLAQAAERLEAAPNLLPGDVRHRAFYRSAFATEGLKAYADAIPPEDQIEQKERYDGQERDFRSTLRRQAQLAVLAFKTGVAVSADLWLGGFDTHTSHDPEWLLGNLADSVDYLWEYAEDHGVADHITRRYSGACTLRYPGSDPPRSPMNPCRFSTLCAVSAMSSGSPTALRSTGDSFAS